MAALKERIQFYHTLATLLEAGLPLSRALKQRFPGKFRRAARRISERLANGSSLTLAMHSLPLFSRFECNLTAAGESTGHLPEVFHALEEWFELSRRLRSRIISGLLYPIFLYLISICILAVIDLFTAQKSQQQIISETLVKLLAPFLAYAIFRCLAKFLLHRSITGQIIACLPILGSLQHQLESARFFKAFGLSLSAGVGVAQSIQLAADCCRNQAFRKRYLKINKILQRRSCSFSDAFAELQTRRDRQHAIPELLQTGEQSGNLDVYAGRISRLCSEAATIQLERISTLLPVLIYMLLVIFIAMKIIGIVAPYGNMLNDLMM